MLQPLVLSYPWDGLVPYISERTLQIHYNRHYLSYLNKLNALLLKSNIPINYPISNLFAGIDAFPLNDRDDILYNSGGVLNHELYFSELSPTPNKEVPEPLNSAIIKKFGSIKNFKDRFIEYATTLPGSGYTFVAINKNGELVLMNLANQDSPYSYGMIPIMNIDNWEHAYYLDRLNERVVYIDAFFQVLNFNKVNQNYQNAMKQTKTS